ncbi:histidine phosphatase family protein [Microlunatus sp. Gsoil 973]|jgi:probable phosphoglycerate mutase|uniref:histidine phosphatase family protein n=1 Tax=Microlunatus sp. Gsoil 973 TaxID=2672569 RepID=UPI0012B4A1C4|nr:histidine phosphatase family protein [Microlunatus sp. Gsoil 973]QGN35550.1 histidine phosphatase family protein [Microlunatus sp. Gsoil 973]
MTELYLVRHGETEWSRSGQHTSVTDLPLTDAGRQQAESLQGELHPGDFGLVLSSPRLRAVDSARLAGFTGDHEPEPSQDLVEWAYGDYEGLTSDEIRERDPNWDLWRDGCPDGESPAQVVERLERVISRVRDSGVGRVIAFGHGHALRALTLRWLDLDLTLGERFPLQTATVSVLGWAKGEPALLRWNASVQQAG